MYFPSESMNRIDFKYLNLALYTEKVLYYIIRLLHSQLRDELIYYKTIIWLFFAEFFIQI